MSEEAIKEQSFGCIPVSLSTGEFLLVQHIENNEPAHFSFPKGHPERFEHETETALRELEEETGLVPDDFSDDPVFVEEYSYQKDGQTAEKQNTFYFALFQDTYEPEILVPEEIAEVAWVSYEEALEQLTYESARDVLREAYLYLTMNGIIAE